jgi:hypothetical protein
MKAYITSIEATLMFVLAIALYSLNKSDTGADIFLSSAVLIVAWVICKALDDKS